MLIKIFEEQVRKHPDNIAVKTETEVLSYDELNRHANRIARIIEDNWPAKKGKNETVGLLFDHGAQMIAAVLGVLKAGKIYVPLTPDYPINRISYMLRNSGTPLVITETRYQEMTQILSNKNHCSWIDINHPKYPAPDESKNSKTEIDGKSLAYIMYTSGSIGKPKGVVQNHENVAYFINNWIDIFSISDCDRITLLAPLCHDISVMDIFSALLSGAAIYPYYMKNREQTRDLTEFLINEKITIWHSVSSLYRYFINSLTGKETFLHLRYILLGGEPVRERDIQMFKRYFPVSTLATIYGQTESSLNSIWLIHPGNDFNKIIIGEPIGSTKIFLINENGKEAAPFEMGEIVVASPHISPGYWKNEELTGKNFSHDPVYGNLYWTGDLGCLFLDGTIEFIGRKDSQVKIRGYRIELGEIENHLLKQKYIKEAAAAVKTDDSGDQFIAAYIVTNPVGKGETPNISELRNYLLQELPDYMIPSYFVTMDKMPLTQSGKIDRKALPEAKARTKNFYVPPRDKIEKKLVEIWREVLFGKNRTPVDSPGRETPSIGIDDNFFELGGHSLKTISLASGIHKEFDVKIPLSRLFKTVTVRKLAEYIKNIKNEEKDKFISITPTENKEYYELSSAQKRMFVMQQMDVNPRAYNMPLAFPVEELDVERLYEAFKKLIIRHESLRTSFFMVDNQPLQKVHHPKELDFEIEYYDSTGSAGIIPEVIIKNFIRPFDLSKAPLVRAGLIKLSEGHNIGMLNIHHIISDGTSRTILTENLIALYNDKALEPLRIQYKDFSRWQNHLFESSNIKVQQDYWLKLYRHAAEIPRLPLPADYKRPKVFTFDGARYGFMLEQEIAEAFKALGTENGATLYMNMLTALDTLFYKYTGQTDIIIGTTIAGRPHADLQKIIGMFVNTLAIRNYPIGEKTYKSFLREVVVNSIKALENQDVQFEQLIEKLELKRDTSRNPLFDISMVVQNFRKIGENPLVTENNPVMQMEESPLMEHNSSSITFSNRTAKFDITFFIHEHGNDIYIEIEYYTGIFKEETIKRLALHFKNIIKEVVRNPSVKLKEIEMISEKEKHQVLDIFNNTGRNYPGDMTLQQLFEEEEKKAPDRAVVVDAMHHAITYRELNEKGNQLARLLKEKGARTDTIVGIIGERSIEMIVGLLGILKAGGAYLPIDPDYPAERKQYMLADSRVNILLAVPGSQVKVKAEIEERFVEIIDIYNLLSSSPLTSTSTCQVGPANLAYIIYTSGTTGNPKGVMVEHFNVVRLVKNTNYVEFRDGDRILQTGAPEFDASTFEIWGALLNGLQLHLVGNDIILTVEKLENIMQKNKITTIWLTSPLFNQLLEQNIEIFNGLRNLLVGGDVLSTPHINRLRNQYPSLNIINGYGPTENTTFSTTYLITGEYHQRIPIGKPIANSRAYIVDKYGYLQPVGVVGELWVGGDGVARGYLNNPQLTGEKFKVIRNLKRTVISPSSLVISNSDKFFPNDQCLMTNDRSYHYPIPPIPHFPIYRTGDLARWLTDGNIEFQGRTDHQVKIRGFRVELAEIENHLMNYPHIKEAVVMAIEVNPGDKQLGAYVVWEQKPDIKGLKEFLTDQLPGYMVPSFFITLSKIPLTSNGKVDRNALPGPEINSDKRYIAPGNEVEKKLGKIWSGVLALSPEHPPIGIDDDFFALGGHSLKAVILTSMIHKTFHVNLLLAEIFNHPTIREMAAIIAATGEKTFKDLEAIEKKEYYQPSYNQKRLLVIHKLAPKSPALNLTGLMELDEPVDEAVIKKSLQQMITRHENLRTKFKIVNNEPVLVIAKKIEIPLQTLDLSMLNETGIQQKRQQIYTESMRKPFDLYQMPLFRTLLVKLAESRYDFIFNIHHIITDGWSMELLKKDFYLLYRRYKGDKSTAIEQEPLLLQYKDFAAWHNKQLTEPSVREQSHRFWQEKLKHGVEELKLPEIFGGNRESGKGTGYHCAISHETKEQLRQLARETGGTLFTVMFSLYLILLARLSDQNQITCAIISAGRKHLSLNNIVGFFVNPILFKIPVFQEEKFKHFLLRVNRDVLETLQHETYPLELVFKDLKMKYPQIPASFNMVNFQDAGIEEELKSFASSHIEEMNDVKFDMEPYVMEFKNGIHMTWNFKKSLFKPSFIEYIVKEYLYLVDFFTTGKDKKLSAYGQKRKKRHFSRKK